MSKAEVIDRIIRRYKGENVYLEKEGLKVVAVGGVFDCIHYGHIYFLEYAKKFGDILVVIVANPKNTQKNPTHTLEERVKLVSSLKIPDVVLAGKEDIYETIRAIMPDVIVYGYDQNPFDVKHLGLKIKEIRAPPYKKEKIKTGKIFPQLGDNEI